MSPVHRSVLVLLALAVLASGVLAQAPPAQTSPTLRGADDLVLHAYTLKNRQASDAISLVFPLLSQKGAVELQPATNTLVIRDTPVALARIIPVLRSYDHPSRPLALDVILVRAQRSPVSGPPVLHSDLPEELTRRLRAMLPYDIYELQAQTRLDSREGQAVTYVLGEEYEVAFRFGILTPDGQRVRLSDFRIARKSDERKPDKTLIHTNLNLWLDQTTSFGLARTEASREALIVVLTLHRGDMPRR
jgi:hypothetical protein